MGNKGRKKSKKKIKAFFLLFPLIFFLYFEYLYPYPSPSPRSPASFSHFFFSIQKESRFQAAFHFFSRNFNNKTRRPTVSFLFELPFLIFSQTFSLSIRSRFLFLLPTPSLAYHFFPVSICKFFFLFSSPSRPLLKKEKLFRLTCVTH